MPPPDGGVHAFVNYTASVHGPSSSPIASSVREVDIFQLPLEKRALMVAFLNLVYRSKADLDRDSLVINFATLQRMRLYKLQSEVAGHALDMRYHNRPNPDWEKSLHEYGKCPSL